MGAHKTEALAFEFFFDELRPKLANSTQDLVEHLSIAACAYDVPEAVLVGPVEDARRDGVRSVAPALA